MELLYLWIGDYKNIKQQGFNFSPKYHFEYDVKNKKLNLIERETTIKDNFFEVEKENEKKIGKNIINVTAIIGGNGAGKSNIAKALVLAEDCFVVFKTDNENNLEVFQTNKFSNLLVKKFQKNGEEYKTYKAESFNNYIFQEEIAKEFLANENVFFIYYDNFFEEFPNRKFEQGYDNFFNESLSSRIGSLNNKNKFAYDEVLNKIKVIDYLQKSDYKLPFLLPDSLTVKVNTDLIERVNKDLDIIDLFTKNKATLVGYKGDFIANLQWSLFYAILGSGEILEIITNPERKKDQLSKLKSILASTSAPKDAYDRIDNLIDDLELEVLKGIKSDIKRVYEILEKNVEVNGKKIKNWLAKDIIELFNILSKLDSLQVGRMFNFEWEKGNEDFYFSTGENTLIRLFATFYKVIFYDQLSKPDESKEELSKEDKSKFKNCIIWIDEGEVGMHPQWQKQYLTILLDVLPKLFLDKKIQLILTSHSPFIVSDLLKENVIFLRKGEKDEKLQNGEDVEGKCIVENDSFKEETFAQNIHVLLSNSFFLQGGLIGDFAKNKINEVVKELNIAIENFDKQISIERVKEINDFISMIGEKLIRVQLNLMLEEATKNSSEDAQRAYYLQKLKDLDKEGGTSND